MDKALYGLIGVALGFLLTFIKDLWVQRTKNKKEMEYLVVQIVCMLDRYISACADVASDDGLFHGQPDKNGYHRIQVDTPKFEPESAKVEWKSLPSGLMYDVLTFPNKIEAADHQVTLAFDYSASPPEYSEGFEERQFQYAKLGIEAHEIACKLRMHAGFPSKSKGDWNSENYLKEKFEQITKRRSERDARHQELLMKLAESSSNIKH